MYRFPSAHAAYCWSYEILDVWRHGSAYDPDPDQYRGGGGTGAMGAVLVALDVERLWMQACRDCRVGCRWYDRDCMLNYYMPDNQAPGPEQTQRQKDYRAQCVRRFEAELKRRGWLGR